MNDVIEAQNKINQALRDLELKTGRMVTGIYFQVDQCIGGPDIRYVEIEVSNKPGDGFMVGSDD